MAATYLVTAAAGGGVGGVSRQVVETLLAQGETVRATVHREDDRAQALRDLGAEVIAGDLNDPRHVEAALTGANRVFFNTGLSERYLETTTVLSELARALPDLDVLVNMSQMTVSQMTATSVGESRQHRLHYLAEQVINWSGVPAVHIRPTVFQENPLFNEVAAGSLRDRDALVLPFGAGRTSPVAARDVAAAVAAVLRSPGAHVGSVYELTGPELLGLNELAQAYGRALGRPITAEPVELDAWAAALEHAGLTAHVRQHLATMARLHRENRYDRGTDDLARLTGQRGQTFEQHVRARRELFDR